MALAEPVALAGLVVQVAAEGAVGARQSSTVAANQVTTMLAVAAEVGVMAHQLVRPVRAAQTGLTLRVTQGREPLGEPAAQTAVTLVALAVTGVVLAQPGQRVLLGRLLRSEGRSREVRQGLRVAQGLQAQQVQRALKVTA